MHAETVDVRAVCVNLIKQQLTTNQQMHTNAIGKLTPVSIQADCSTIQQFMSGSHMYYLAKLHLPFCRTQITSNCSASRAGIWRSRLCYISGSSCRLKALVNA